MISRAAELKEVECLIRGRVTGVMFRDFVWRKARSLGLVGSVKNRSDRTVLVLAQGDEASLRRLLGYLKQGPIFSKVDKVEVIWREPFSELKGFNIVY